ncbi:MAG: ArsR family transcriptional regulator [Francisella sp.]|jgi:ArsR family transcriptional regulator
MKENQFSEKYNDVITLSKVLSHPARILILELLANSDECVGDIVKQLPLSQSTISQHLKELKDARILLSKTVANKNYYCIDKKEFNRIYKDFISKMNEIVL